MKPFEKLSDIFPIAEPDKKLLQKIYLYKKNKKKEKAHQ